MISIFFASLTSTIILAGSGFIFSYLFNNSAKEKIDLSTAGLFGIIFLSFFSLLLNFFFPLNKLVGTIVLIVTFLTFLKYTYDYKKKIEIFFFVSCVSLVTFFLITLSNVNRPDAGLYHLPYTSILNDSKIIIGSSNIHFRFGHTSIIQYLSAIYNNFFFKIEFITIPLASIFSFFIFFISKKFFTLLKKKTDEKIFIYFIIIIFSFYAFNRYSNYGNDAPVHLYFFFLIILFTEIKSLKKIDLHEFYNLVIVSIFLLSLKPFLVLTLLLPLTIFLINKKKIYLIKKKQFYLSLSLIFLLFLKNILISGCMIFPINKTCFKSLKHFDKTNTLFASNEAEAWAKGLPDSKKNYSSFEEYSTGFNWVSTWLDNHFLYVVEKILPYIVLLFIILFSALIRKIYYNEKINNFSINTKDIILTIFSFVFCVAWFFKFPVYRFGTSFIVIFINCIFIIFLRKIENFNENLKFYKIFFLFFFFIAILGFIGKNSFRILNKFDHKYNGYPWPKIYTLGEINNIMPNFTKITDEKNKIIFYYSGGGECMYSKAPCSNYINSELKVTNKYGYKIYYKK